MSSMHLLIFLVLSEALWVSLLILVAFGVKILKDIGKSIIHMTKSLEHTLMRVDHHEKRLDNHEIRIKGLEK